MNVVIINPPLVQLNTPYPSGAYLSSFFKQMECSTKWYDLSLELYYSIFSKSGLSKLFELTEKKALKMVEQAQINGDDSTAYNLQRYISTKNSWILWIDTINSILQGNAREKEHQFLYSPFAPRGNRMDNYLASLNQEPTVDDVKFLCSYALADLADYITAVFDSNFSLIRYAESVAAESRSFLEIEKNIDSPVMKEFYEPLLEQKLGGESLPLASACKQSSATPSTGDTPVTPPNLFLISVPFAGTFVPALCTAKFIRKKYPNAKIAIGGGYVNTEMRNFSETLLGKYVDYISYDRGYGSYKALLTSKSEEIKPLYKMTQFLQNGKVVLPQWQNQEMENFESEITAKIFPDYTDIDFSRYLRVCDDKNAMHRLWTDGAWIKAYLAHGCYWHKCAFCDTKLDYVCGYKMVQVEKLYENLLQTTRQKNVYGIHFVDEALPPVALIRFAICNAKHGNPLYFWGNVRFEKTFTKDLAAFLSYCGFGGVSAGIEVATKKGLENVNKGTTMDSIVSACAAFKEAGILVHSYMIYGFWYDTPQTIIDSMETLRQFFAAGLLDSAFWHQFMLTKNSELYPKLKETFTEKQMQAFQKYGPALDSAVTAWMHGQKIEMKVQKWFNFSVPSPTVEKDFVEKLIEKYEKIANCELNIANCLEGIYWLGSEIVMQKSKNTTLTWFYLNEEYQCVMRNAQCVIINSLSPTAAPATRAAALEQIKKSPELQNELQRFHNKGLVIIDNY